MEHLRRLVEELALAGYQLDRSAYDYLIGMKEAEATTFARDLLLKIVQKPPSDRILSKTELLEMEMHENSIHPELLPSVSTTIPAKQIASDIEVIKDPSKGDWHRQ